MRASGGEDLNTASKLLSAFSVAQSIIEKRLALFVSSAAIGCWRRVAFSYGGVQSEIKYLEWIFSDGDR